jgi:limonene-1,2-epoxide hydrolase
MDESGTDPESVVRGFLGDLERLDVEAAAQKLADDVVYQNVPLPAARGRRAVETQLRWLVRYGSGFEVRYHNLAVNGTTVLTERNDVLIFGPVRADFWVCGTFEVVDGHITLWRDRFDFFDFTFAFVRGAAQALVGAVAGRREGAS